LNLLFANRIARKYAPKFQLKIIFYFHFLLFNLPISLSPKQLEYILIHISLFLRCPFFTPFSSLSNLNSLTRTVPIITYFATNLAITLIRKSVAEGLKCVLYPVYGPDVSFIDPATARVFPLLWETPLTITTKDQPISSTAYVVQDEEIGASIIIGMDTIIAIKGTIMIDEEEHSNPLFPMPRDEKVLCPKPVWATGLGVSLASQAYASKSETAVVPHDGPDRYYDCVTRSHFFHHWKDKHASPHQPKFLCTDLKNHYPHNLRPKLYAERRLPTKISGHVHLLAANISSPPVPPARTINSRPNVPKVRPKRPCAIPMHGGPGSNIKNGGGGREDIVDIRHHPFL
jgi:hypothetical protein